MTQSKLDVCLDQGKDEAWAYVFESLIKGREQQVQWELRETVCCHYWWLTGVLWELEGELGWEAGDREWDGDTYMPRPTRTSWAGLKKFIFRLSETPRSEVIPHMLVSVDDPANLSLEARTFRRLMERTDQDMQRAVWYMYDRILTIGTVYQLAAAREFFRMAEAGSRFLAVCGMILILARKLDPLKAAQEQTMLRHFQATRPTSAYSAINCTRPTEGVAVNAA